MLYATLKGGGLVAVDMTNGTKKWTYPTTKGDAYFPIVDKMVISTLQRKDRRQFMQ